MLLLLNHAYTAYLKGLGLLAPYSTSTSVSDRMLALFSGLSGPYMMLSLSYEPLFLLCFCYTLYLWLNVENCMRNKRIAVNDNEASVKSLPFIIFSPSVITF